MELFGRCDLLINNAGVSACGEVTEATERDLQWVTSVNYFAHFYMMRRFIPQMIKQNTLSNSQCLFDRWHNPRSLHRFILVRNMRQLLCQKPHINFLRVENMI